MSTTIIPFTSGEWEIRAFEIDGEPWFVASDVAKSLGYGKTNDLTRRLDDEDKGARSVRTLGGEQKVTIISEPGLYAAVLGSQLESARAFKRWITHEVIPAIRKTGSFSVEQVTRKQLALAVLEAEKELEVTKPKAEAWDALASADGDYEVADAAKILARDGVETGRQRLFNQLAEIGWLYRGSDRRWRAYQPPVDRGYLAQRPQYHYHPGTGERVIDAPQVRVTVRGIDALRRRLSKQLEVAS